MTRMSNDARPAIIIAHKPFGAFRLSVLPSRRLPGTGAGACGAAQDRDCSCKAGVPAAAVPQELLGEVMEGVGGAP